jgi:acyl carrier protein
MSTNERVKAFITTNFYVPDPAALSDDDSLLDRGIVDSTGVLEIIGFLEQEFGVTVDDAEILPENLDSIGRIVQFVAKKKEH